MFVFIDESGDVGFKFKAGSSKFFKFEDSKTNNLIQLADMIAGATNNFYLKKNKESIRYRELFKNKIVLEIIFKG